VRPLRIATHYDSTYYRQIFPGHEYTATNPNPNPNPNPNQIFPGHEYTVMLMEMAVRTEPMNAAARRCLRSAQVTPTRTRTLSLTPTLT